MTTPCYLTIHPPEHCAPADHTSCDSLFHLAFKNPFVYYKQCCDEQWNTRVSFNSGFLSVYAQQWDFWIIRQFYRCPSADEWIRKLWYIYTMEYYPAIKKNTFESVLMRWMKLEPIIQSEVSQKEKHQYSILTSGAAAQSSRPRQHRNG